MADVQPIILIKKKVHHGGHHGGAWKVAYADFVTAMMALFIVLWLLSSTSKQTQEQIAGYFNDPKGTTTKKGSDGKPGSKAQYKHTVDMDALKKQLQLAIQKIDLLNKLQKQIEITVTEEGLRVDLIEDKNGTFFELGSAKPTPALQEILKLFAEELKQVPNQISIEGHTDAQPYAEHAEYDNWELSSDRANEARREMKANGIRPGQVYEVLGFADQRLRLPEKPYDPANRRVSIVVQPLQISTKSARTSESQAKNTALAKEPGQGPAEKKPTTAEHTSTRAELESSEQPSTKAGTPASAQQDGRGDSEASQPKTEKAAAPVATSKPGIFLRVKKIFGN